jgi:hypothetical protein
MRTSAANRPTTHVTTITAECRRATVLAALAEARRRRNEAVPIPSTKPTPAQKYASRPQSQEFGAATKAKIKSAAQATPVARAIVRLACTAGSVSTGVCTARE